MAPLGEVDEEGLEAGLLAGHVGLCFHHAGLLAHANPVAVAQLVRVAVICCRADAMLFICHVCA